MTLVQGQRIGAYEIVRPLGAGGMGAVYEAVHTEIGRKAAIKVLHPHLAADPQIAARFLNEARATSSVDHPGMVAVFEFGRQPDGTTFMVMEFLRGDSLRGRLQRLGRLPYTDALRLCRQVAGALSAAHQRGVIHRDLKPDNIMIVPDPEAQSGERAKVLDFGIAKISQAEAGSVRTQTGAMMGTPSYMAPEQFQGAGQADAKADVYALGVVLFELLSGRLPFQGQSLGALVLEHLQTLPPALSSVAPGLPAGLDRLVAAMLIKDPAQRPAMAECMAEMERLGGGASTGPGPLAPPLGAFIAGAGAGPVPLSTLGQAAGQHGITPPNSPAPPRRSSLREWAPGLVVLAGVGLFAAQRLRSSGPAPTSGMVSTASVAGTSSWQQAVDNARRMAEQAAQHPPRLPPLKVMRICQTACIERIHDSRERYLSWADAQRGPTGHERNIYGLYRISDGCNICQQQLDPQGRELPGDLKKLAPLFLDQLARLTPVSDEAYRYYERKAYLDDGMAQGQKLHQPLLAALIAAGAAGRQLYQAADALEDESLRQGPSQLPALAKEVARAGGRPMDDIEVARLGGAQQAFERALDAAPPSDTFQRSGAEGVAAAGRDLLRRLRDHKPVEGMHRTWVGTSSGWMVEGTPDQLINKYNSYAGHADLLALCRHYLSAGRP